MSFHKFQLFMRLKVVDRYSETQYQVTENVNLILSSEGCFGRHCSNIGPTQAERSYVMCYVTVYTDTCM